MKTKSPDWPAKFFRLFYAKKNVALMSERYVLLGYCCFDARVF